MTPENLASEGQNQNPPAGANTPSPEPGAPPKKRLLEISEDTRYEVPENLEIPENILRGIREKDRVIREQKRALAELQQKIREKESLQQDDFTPDPYEDPKAHAQWLQKSLYENLSKQLDRRQNLLLSTKQELEALHKLTNGDEEKIERVLKHLKSRGYGVVQEGDQYFLQPGVVEDAYRAVFFEELVESEKKKVKEELQKELEKARSSAYSPGQVFRSGSQEKPVERMTREERIRRMREDDTPFGEVKHP